MRLQASINHLVSWDQHASCGRTLSASAGPTQAFHRRCTRCPLRTHELVAGRVLGCTYPCQVLCTCLLGLGAGSDRQNSLSISLILVINSTLQTRFGTRGAPRVGTRGQRLISCWFTSTPVQVALSEQVLAMWLMTARGQRSAQSQSMGVMPSAEAPRELWACSAFVCNRKRREGHGYCFCLAGCVEAVASD